jgi:hypothetical protein
MSKLIILIMLTSLGISAQAAQERGGGSFEVCKDAQSNLTVILQDYFEAQQATTLKIDMGPDGSDYAAKIRYVTDRLKKLDPVFARLIQDRADRFISETAFLDRSEIPDIYDKGPYLEPKKCSLVQVGANKVDPLPAEKKYLIDADLWKLADEQTKAGLVLHEVIYAAVREFGIKTSATTRYFNALISSTTITEFNNSQYIKLLTKMNWIDPSADMVNEAQHRMFSVVINGLTVATDGIKYEGKHLSDANINAPSPIKTPRGTVLLPSGVRVLFRADGSLSNVCDTEYNVRTMQIYGKETKFHIYITSPVGAFEVKYDSKCFDFDSQGHANRS